MRLLVLAVLAVVMPLAFAIYLPNRYSKVSYIVYMPTRFTRFQNYDVYVIIYDVMCSVSVSIFVDWRLAHHGTLQPGVALLLSIDYKSFSNRYWHTIRVKATVKSFVLFDRYKFIYNNYYIGQKKKAVIFIEKDKSFYKPTDMIRFRCFALNNDLNVVKSPLDIELRDPLDNLMQIWFNQTCYTGVVSKEFQLSDQPVLGRWKIKIHQHHTHVRKTNVFSVEKYVLPPIKVTLGGDKYICHLGLPAFYVANRYVHLEVTARYGFGGPVKGKVILKISINGRQKISIQRVFRINGALMYHFRMSEFFKGKCDPIIYQYGGMPSYITLTILAKVIEEETHLDFLSAPMYVSLVKAPIKIVSPYTVAIKPGLCNEVTVYIKRIDLLPLTHNDVRERLNVTFFGNKKIYSILICIPLDGVVIIHLPRVYYSRMIIYYYGFYQECRYTLVKTTYLRRFTSPVPYYVKASLKRSHCYAGDYLNIIIESTALIRKVYYLVVKDNQFIGSGHVFAYGHFVIVHIKSSKLWIPGVKIIFTCITIRGNVLIDILAVKLSLEFKYQVTGMYIPKHNRAGQRTILNMASCPGSTLFIVAVDERLEFLKKNNYLTKNSILNHFRGISNLTPPGYIFDIPSLLRWCQIAWISNKLRNYRVYSSKKIVAKGGPLKAPKTKLGSKIHALKQPSLIKSVVGRYKVRVRDEFPEVWLWLKRYVGYHGYINIHTKAPDSITTWITNAFAIHPTKGISVLERPLKFVSFKILFLILNLPYSVIQNERLVINIITFNYQHHSQEVTVVLKNPHLIYRDYPKKTIVVPAGSYKNVRFSIRPIHNGDIPIEIDLFKREHSLNVLVDSLRKILKVKPEGRPVYFHQLYELNMHLRNPFNFNYSIYIPTTNVVPNSQRIEVVLTGDVMGPAIDGLRRRVRYPWGYGERIALFLVQNIYIYDYLTARHALDDILKARLILYTRFGYQNMLRYQKRDGSYSAFQWDKKGSVWLTAFIVKAFKLVIKSHMKVYIDRVKLRRSLAWLIKKQTAAGTFKETGRVYHKGMQGGAADCIPLTAYTVIALIEAKDLLPKLTGNAIKKAMTYLKGLKFERLDVYTLCILLFTFARKCDHISFVTVEKILLPKATETPTMMFWKGEYSTEQTAYVLRAYAFNKDLQKGIKIFRWILSKQNFFNGYYTVQDIVVSLEAMAKFALLLKHTTSADVTIRAKNHFVYRFTTITSINLYVIQRKKVPKDTRIIHGTARGNGIVYMIIFYQYYVYTNMDDNFGLIVTVKSVLGRRLKIFIRYEWTKQKESGLLFSIVCLPSGFKMEKVTCEDQAGGSHTSTSADNCLSSVFFINDKVYLYLKNFCHKQVVNILIICKRTHMVDNKETNMFIRTTSIFEGKSVVVSYNPFVTHLSSQNVW